MLRKFLAPFIASLLPSLAVATHFSGGEIYWHCLGNNQYEITLVVYRDCAGINVDPTVTLQLQSPCGNTSLVVSTPGGVEISQLCDMELPNSTCNGGSLPGIEQYIYTGTITLAPCDSWTISYTNIYRNNAIVNLQNPGTQRTYVRAVVNTTVTPCNDSPQFSNTAIPFVCLGYPITYSFGAFDPESDSLSYVLIDAMGINGAPIPYMSPSTGTDPIPGITLDPATGEVNFTLSTQGNWVVVVQVNHWVNGVLVGSIMRDMQFVAYPCSNDPPDPITGLIQTLSGAVVQLGPRAIQLCESGNFCFDFVISDPNLPNVLDAFSNIQQNLPGATFTFNGFNPITCTVCWTASPGTAGYFPFIVNVNDGACPIPAFQTYIYEVTVIPGLYGGVNTTDASCVGNADGTATSFVTTGTAPITYAWSTGATTPSIGAGPGSYTVTMTDANNCVSPPYTAVISTIGQPNQANAGPDAVGCIGSFPIALNGNVVNATGGNWNGGFGNFAGAWPNVSYNPSPVDIANGGATLVLTTTGNVTCPAATDTLFLFIPNSFANTTVGSTDATCAGINSGTATFAPTLPGFSYQWNTLPPQFSSTAIGLGAGTYDVTATDSSGCTTTLTATVSEPAAIMLAALNVVDETCVGSGNGTITAVVSGGTPPYAFTWTTGETTSSITAGAGSYGVSITDANGCAPANGSATINAAAQPNQANAGPDAVGCVGSFPIALNGNVVNATGGSWSGGTESFSGAWPNVSYDPSAADIANGGVTLTLATTGNTNCPAVSDDVLISIPNSFASATVVSTDATCFGINSGSASFSPTSPGFSYQWNTLPVQYSSTAIGLGAGSYDVTTTDSSGCTVTLSAIINEPAATSLVALNVVDESCAGFNNGSIAAQVSGGTPPYDFTWSNGGTSNTITAGAGTYSVSITDANGCAPVGGSATINAAAQPNQANAGADLVGCIGSFPVALFGNVMNATGGSWSGGNGNYSGTWPNVSYGPSATDIASGGVTLTLTTTGNTNCPAVSDDLFISIPNSFANATVSSTDATCFGINSGTATFAPTQSGFSYAWNTTPAQYSSTAIGLGAGSYDVTATDNAGCTVTLTATVNEPAAVNLTALNVVDESCAGSANGSITSNTSGGTLPYSYSWSNGETTSAITAGAGTYSVSVTDANGCAPATGSATINATGQPNQANAGADLVGCLGSYPILLQGSVVSAPGGDWSGGSGTFVVQGVSGQYVPTTAEIQAGGVTLTLTTTGNTTCPPASDDVTVALSNSFIGAVLTTSNVSCNNAADGSIAFAPDNAGNNYLWNDGQTTPTATNLGPGSYAVIITDALGCDTSLTATITQPWPLAITSLFTSNVTCNGGNNGTANVQVTGGTPNYAINWSTGQSGPSVTAITAGNLTVTVIDANGCGTTSTVAITEPPPIIVLPAVPDTVCGNAPVMLSAQATGGTGTLNFNWGPLGTGNPITVSLSSSQNVQLSVNDQNGCTTPALIMPVHVLDLNAGSFTTYGDTAICPGGDAAYVGALLSGYAGSYTISWIELANAGNGPFTVPFTADQDLHVTVTDECGNTIDRVIALRVQTPPVIDLPAVFAEGCAPLTVDFPDLQLDPSISYLWTLGNGSTSASPSPVVVYLGGNYSVGLTVSTPLGCSSTSPTNGQVLAWQPPAAGFTASTYTTTADNASINFNDASTGNIATWSWLFGDGGTGNAMNPTHSYTEVGTFEAVLYVTDVHGCTGEASADITITPVYDVVIPNAFTPNGSGSNGGAYDPNDLHNDVFYAFVRFVKEFRMRVFNRWGELVFESDDVMLGWDGYYRGELSPQDVYVVQTWIRFADNKEVQKLTDLTLFR